MTVVVAAEIQNESAYERLYVSLLDGLEMLQILIAVYEDVQVRNQIMARYEQGLQDQARGVRVQLDLEEPSLRRAVELECCEGQEQPVFVTVLGVDRLSTAGLERFWGYLQWTREGLRAFRCPIVLWLPVRLMPQLAKQAPDFWSWRNGVFVFRSGADRQVDQRFTAIDRIGSEADRGALSVEQLEDSLHKGIFRWGEDSLDLEPLYAQLGKVYLERIKSGQCRDRAWEFSRAEEMLGKAIDLQTQQPGSLAKTLTDLGDLYYHQGFYAQAEPHFLQALDLRKDLWGSEHSDVANSLNNLALLYSAQGRYGEAEEFYRRSLQIREQVLPADHPHLATSYNNLAILYKTQKRYLEAEPLYNQAIQIRMKTLGSDHPKTQKSIDDYETFLQDVLDQDPALVDHWLTHGSERTQERLRQLLADPVDQIGGQTHPDP